MEVLRKYGVQADIYFPLIKAATANFAVSGDFTHAAGDTKISKDGGAAASTTNNPSAITMGAGGMWKLTLTATEMQAALIAVTIIDTATKAVEDQMFLIATYGHASAQHEMDFDTPVPTVATIQSGLATQSSLTTVAGYIDTEVAAIKAKTDNLPTDPADASDIAAAIAALNNVSVANILAGIIEGSLTLKDVLRLVLAVEVGKSTGGGTTSVAFRDNADTKNRIAATVNSSGNRSSVTLDPS